MTIFKGKKLYSWHEKKGGYAFPSIVYINKGYMWPKWTQANKSIYLFVHNGQAQILLLAKAMKLQHIQRYQEIKEI